MGQLVHDFRPRAARLLAGTSAAAIIPFAIWDIVGGDRWIGVALLAVAAGLTFSTWLVDAGHHSPIASIALFVVPTTTVIAWGVVAIDVYLTYWSFVAVTATYLVLPQRWAWGASGFIVAVVAPVAGHQHGWWVGARLAVCLLLVAVFAGVAVRLVDRLQRELVAQVITDPLTGVLNRTTLASEIGRVIDRAPGASLLAIDVDDFKTINDRFGHGAGDRVLVDLAIVLRSTVRDDTPLFRLGGEEFMMIIEGGAFDSGRGVARRLVETVAAHRFLDAHSVTVSVGVADLTRHDTIDEWMQRADRALYAAKAAGRNTLVVG